MRARLAMRVRVARSGWVRVWRVHPMDAHVALAEVRDTPQPPGARCGFSCAVRAVIRFPPPTRGITNCEVVNPSYRTVPQIRERSNSGVRRYRSRTAPGPGGGTVHRHWPRFLAFERHGRHHPRLRAAAAVHYPHRGHGAAREACSATGRRPPRSGGCRWRHAHCCQLLCPYAPGRVGRGSRGG